MTLIFLFLKYFDYITKNMLFPQVVKSESEIKCTNIFFSKTLQQFNVFYITRSTQSAERISNHQKGLCRIKVHHALRVKNIFCMKSQLEGMESSIWATQGTSKNYVDKRRYSYLPNSRGASDKRGGRKISEKLINREGQNASNKQGGWKIY